MAEHEVMVQNIEENDEAVSATGLVDGRQTAVVILKARIPKGTKGNALQRFYAESLARAYEARPAAPPSAHAIKVST